MDWLASLFLGAFVFGLIFCLASLLLGFSHLSLDGHGPYLHTGHGADLAGHDLHGVPPAHPSDVGHDAGAHSPSGSAPTTR